MENSFPIRLTVKLDEKYSQEHNDKIINFIRVYAYKKRAEQIITENNELTIITGAFLKKSSRQDLFSGTEKAIFKLIENDGNNVTILSFEFFINYIYVILGFIFSIVFGIGFKSIFAGFIPLIFLTIVFFVNYSRYIAMLNDLKYGITKLFLDNVK